MAWVVVIRSKEDDMLLDGTKFRHKGNAWKYIDELRKEKADGWYENSYFDIEECDPLGSFADDRCVDDDD